MRKFARLLLSIAFVASLIVMQSCKKDDNLLNTNGGGGSDTTGVLTDFSNSFFQGGVPIPNLSGTGGVVGVSDLFFTTLINGEPVLTESKLAFAGFVKAGAIDTPFVYGGNVLIDSAAIDSLHVGTQVIYMRPNSHNSSAGFIAPFDGATPIHVSVQGNALNGVGSFEGSVVAPNLSYITFPAQSSMVSAVQNLTVTWSGAGSSELISIILEDQHHAVGKRQIANTGSSTFTAAELSNFQPGFGTIVLVKSHVVVVNGGGKDYQLVAEVVNPVSITWK